MLEILLTFHFLSRNGQGNIKCITFGAKHSPSSAPYEDGYGGKDGIGALGCTSQYKGIGHQCIAIPPEPELQQSKAAIDCIEKGGTLFNPIEKLQNQIVGAMMEEQVRSKLPIS